MMRRRRVWVLMLVLLLGLAIVWLLRSPAPERVAPVSSGTASSSPSRRVDRSGLVAASSETQDAGDDPSRVVPLAMRSGVIAGTVYRDGQPAADVVVSLQSRASWAGLGLERSVRSDAGGRFSFGVQPGGRYSVIAAAPDRVTARAEVQVGSSAQVPPSDRTLLFLGPCEAVLYGVIQDASGGPVQGARIGTSTLANYVAYAVTSDERGAYRLCVRRGLEAVSIKAAGYGAVERVVAVLGTRRLDVALSPAVVVEGTVVDPAGAPAARVRVQLLGWGDDVERLSRQIMATDEDGRFRVESAPGFGTLYAGTDNAWASQAIELQAGETRTVVLQLRAGVPVRGRVVMGGEPVAGVELQVGSMDGSSSAVSEADGSFTASSVPIGATQVGSRTHRIVSGGSLAVPAAGLDGVEIEVAPFGRIVGRIEVHGGPAIGAQAALRWPGRTKLATTDAQGALRFEGIEPGVYTLDITDDGARARAPSLSVEVTGDETVDLGVVALSPTGRIAGRVVDESSLPVVDAYVVAEPVAGGDGDGAAVTDESGGFVIDGLGLGAQAIQVRLRDVDLLRIGEAAPVELTAVRAEALGLTIVVRVRRGAIAGRVVDAAGAPLADVGIHVRVSGDTRSWSFVSSAAVTGLDGRFRVDNLPAGLYDLQARQRRGRTAAVSGVEAPSQGVKLVISEAGQSSPRK